MKLNGSNKKIYVLVMLVIIGIVIFTFGLTYSFWQYTNTQTGENVVNTECFSIDFTGENDIDIPNAYPMKDDELESFLSTATPYHFTITNNCNSQASATINLESLNAEAERQLADEWIDAILYETDYHSKLNKATQLTANPLNDANKVIKESLHAYSLKNITLKANDVKNYNLLLYLDQQTPLNEETQNATWKGKITLSAEYKYDQFVNSGTLRTISVSDTKGMWGYKDKITKIVIETKKSEKTGSEGQTVHGPFNEGDFREKDAIQSYVVCDTEETNCTGYLQGEGGIKLNSDSRNLFYGFSKVTKIEGIENLDTRDVTDMSSMFYRMSSIEELDLSSFNTSSVTDMDSMFFLMSSLQTLTFGENFDTHNVTDMSFMFGSMQNLQKLDISSIDTSSVITMQDMFSYMSNLQSLTFGKNFDTSRVEDMSWMFNGMSNIEELDLSTFDTSNVTDMSSMFDSASKLTKITYGPNFIHNDEAYTSSMFEDCPANKPDKDVHPSWEGVSFD